MVRRCHNLIYFEYKRLPDDYSKPTQGRRMVQFSSWNFLLPAFPTLWESTFGQQDTLRQSEVALYLSGPIRREFTKSRRLHC